MSKKDTPTSKSTAIGIIAAFAMSFVALASPFSTRASEGIHLILLTGDERMQKMNESQSFLPHLLTELPPESIVLVKAAYEKKHLGHWHDGWSVTVRGREIRDYAQGWILDELIQKARSACGEKPIRSVTLVWAQGVTDTATGYSASYEESFHALAGQLAKALGRDDLQLVIARLGTAEEPPKRYPEWEAVKTAQEQLGNSLAKSCWVDTDAVIARSKDYSESLGMLLADATLKQIAENSGSETTAFPDPKTPAKKQPAHLFLLSGQSNMAGLDPEEAFVPAVVEEFGEEGAIVVKAAYGAKSIQHWYKPSRNEEDTRNWLYRELIGKTKFALANREIQSVTLAWMQGEADASNEASASAYAENFEGLLQQLREDLGREDIHFVIGRLSDHSNPEKFPSWEQMRSTQEKIANSTPLGRWIDTDAFNGDDNNLHYPSGENGKVALANAFAKEAIELARSTEN